MQAIKRWSTFLFARSLFVDSEQSTIISFISFFEMSVQLGWFAEDFKLLSHLRQLITSKVTRALSNAHNSELMQNEIFKIEGEDSSSQWMRIILPHGLSTGHQLIGALQTRGIFIFLFNFKQNFQILTLTHWSGQIYRFSVIILKYQKWFQSDITVIFDSFSIYFLHPFKQLFNFDYTLNAYL